MSTYTNSSARLISAEDILAFVLGGNAVFTLVSRKTNNRYTYRVRAATRKNANDFYFVDRLVGDDNTSDYAYFGVLYRSVSGSWVFRNKKLTDDSPIARALEWLFAGLDLGADLPGAVEFWTSGHCSRCGRLLTVPESIELGMGPVCREKTLAGI